MSSTSSLTDRLAQEREASTRRDPLAESTRLKTRFPHLAAYPSRRRLDATTYHYTADLCGKTILDYGCGQGGMALKYLDNGADKVAAIDISEVCVDELRQRARSDGFERHRCDFRAMDAHRLDFADATFDLIVGYGILHHLDPDVAFAELHRVLKPDGRVLLQEPLVDNPVLKIFRRAMPDACTEDDVLLTGTQVRALENRHGWRTESVYCGVIEMPVSLLTSKLMPACPDNFLLRWADKLESWLHRRRWLLSWNQYVVFNLVKADQP